MPNWSQVTVYTIFTGPGELLCRVYKSLPCAISKMMQRCTFCQIIYFRDRVRIWCFSVFSFFFRYDVTPGQCTNTTLGTEMLIIPVIECKPFRWLELPQIAFGWRLSKSSNFQILFLKDSLLNGNFTPFLLITYQFTYLVKFTNV